MEQGERELMLLAIVDDKVIGSASFQPVAPCDKCKHRAEFGISIKKEYWGLFVGTILTQACIENARKANFVQIELEVVTSNERAIKLYEKCGFQAYGVREHSFRYRDGHYESMTLMMRKL